MFLFSGYYKRKIDYYSGTSIFCIGRNNCRLCIYCFCCID